jgi:hypothetical protein
MSKESIMVEFYYPRIIQRLRLVCKCGLPLDDSNLTTIYAFRHRRIILKLGLLDGLC